MKIFFLLISISSYYMSGFSQKPDTIGAAALFTKMMGQINPKHTNWVKSTAATVNQKKQTETEVKVQATNWAVLGSLNNADIEALCFLVLMQASKSAQEDLKAIMAKVKSINEQKAKQRQLLSAMQKEKAMSAIQMDSFKFLNNRTKAFRNGNNPDAIKLVRSGAANKSISKAEVDAMLKQTKSDLDSMNEMGEMESLRLQMAMDRMSKMMSTLSNLLKKISDSVKSITQNLK